MKIMQMVPEQDIPVEAINEILGRAIKLFHD
jgi:hypothetical protein